MVSPVPKSLEEAAMPKTSSPGSAATDAVMAEDDVAITGDYLERLPNQDMNPKNILTGIYGSRGERVRHTVQEGAMRMPAASIEILNALTEETKAWTTKGSIEKTKFQLPGLDDVHRPTMDTNLGSIRVVELGLAPVPQPAMPMQYPGAPPPPVQESPKWRTVATTRTLTLEESTPTVRIRGGGDEAAGDGEDAALTPAVAAIEPEAAAAPSAADPAASTEAMDIDDVGGAATTVHIASQPLPSSESKTQDVAPTIAPPQAAETVEPTSDDPPVPSTESTDIAMADATSSSVNDISVATDALAPTSSGGGSQPAQAQSATGNVTTDGPPVVMTDSKAVAPTAASATASEAPAAVKSGEVASVASTVPAPTSSDATPASVPSSVAAQPASASAPRGTGFTPLVDRPASQWEQHVPGANDEMPKEPKTPSPPWYSKDKVSDLERTTLPEWFDESASHRTPDSYREARERVIHISDKLGNRNVTSTHVRRTIPGDAGSLTRLHNFLVTWGFINEDAINDSCPTAVGLREDAGASKNTVLWNERAKEELAEAVVEEAVKRRKLDQDGASVESSIDWEGVAARMQNGAGPAECERAFLFTPLPSEKTSMQVERSITPEVLVRDATAQLSVESKEAMLKELIDQSRPEVIKAATDAALRATNNLIEAQKAAVFALVSSQATERALKEEDAVSRLMTELHEQRMQKLENRLALMDDVEGMLEAERVALELERRDLYTARCRHWFGGGS